MTISEKKKRPLFRRILKYGFRGIGVVLLVFIAFSFIPITQTVTPIQPRASTQYWTLDGGYRIAYTRISGDTSKRHPPIIFLHGGPGGYIHSSIIERMNEVAKRGYDIYLYDQIGSGLSDRLPRPKDYSFGRHVSDLKEIIINQIKAPSVILVGQSFGTILAAHFTAHNPSLVDKLILTSPGPLQPMRVDKEGQMIDLTQLYRQPDSLTFKEPKGVWQEVEGMLITPRIIMTSLCAMVFNVKWASDREMDDLVNTMAAKFTAGMVCNPENVLPEEGGGGGYSHIFSNWYADIDDPRPVLRDFHIPTLVLQGECDQNPYSDAYEYVDLFKGKYKFIKDAGHEIWWEKPDEFVSSISTFLAEPHE